MLCQFTFKNYKSYRDETILDMQAVSSQGFEHSLLPDGNKQELLPVAAIYGPNAGGKSNVLDALKCLHSLVVFPILLFRGQTTAQAVNCVPFLFDEKTPEEPQSLSIVIRSLFRRERSLKRTFTAESLHRTVVSAHFLREVTEKSSSEQASASSRSTPRSTSRCHICHSLQSTIRSSLSTSLRSGLSCVSSRTMQTPMRRCSL